MIFCWSVVEDCAASLQITFLLFRESNALTKESIGDDRVI